MRQDAGAASDRRRHLWRDGRWRAVGAPIARSIPR